MQAESPWIYGRIDGQCPSSGIKFEGGSRVEELPILA